MSGLDVFVFILLPSNPFEVSFPVILFGISHEFNFTTVCYGATLVDKRPNCHSNVTGVKPLFVITEWLRGKFTFGL